MTCPHLEETSALFDGELRGDDAAQARQHLAACAACSALQHDLLQLRGALQAARTFTCSHLQQTSALLDGALRGDDAMHARQHLAACAACRSSPRKASVRAMRRRR